MEKIYIFGYGSLLNPKSRGNTYDALDVIESVTLNGYQRKCNADADTFLAMNIVPVETQSIVGVLTEIREEDLPTLRKREVGYAEVDVTDKIDVLVEGRVLVFIAPDESHPDNIILQSYLDTCLGGVDPSLRQKWISDTIIENPIVDDREDPQYGNYVPLTRT